MKDTPQTVEVKNGADNNEIGKESGQIHKFLCHLRHAGATYADLVTMRDIGPELAAELIAKIRGIQLPPDRAHLLPGAQMVNLDYELGYPEPLTKFTGPFFAQRIEVTRDN